MLFEKENTLCSFDLNGIILALHEPFNILYGTNFYSFKCQILSKFIEDLFLCQNLQEKTKSWKKSFFTFIAVNGKLSFQKHFAADN